MKNSLNSAVNRSSRTIGLQQKSGEDKNIRPEPLETPTGYIETPGAYSIKSKELSKYGMTNKKDSQLKLPPINKMFDNLNGSRLSYDKEMLAAKR